MRFAGEITLEDVGQKVELAIGGGYMRSQDTRNYTVAEVKAVIVGPCGTIALFSYDQRKNTIKQWMKLQREAERDSLRCR